jgi:hypothetical protein
VPRPCKLCTHPDQVAVRAALGAGETDRAVAGRFDLSHVSAGRHRRDHVVRSMQLAAAAMDKGRAVRERRDEVMQQAAEDDPTAIFKLDSIATDLARIAARLDAVADQAAAGELHTAHAALAGQLLRQTEMRARFGAHDRPAAQAGAVATFSVQINLGDRVETITVATLPAEGGGGSVDCAA